MFSTILVFGRNNSPIKVGFITFGWVLKHMKNMRRLHSCPPLTIVNCNDQMSPSIDFFLKKRGNGEFFVFPA